MTSASGEGRRLRQHVVRPVLGCLLIVGTAVPARAACSFSAVSGVSFGLYNVFSSSPVDSTGQFTWKCDVLTFPYVRITLTKGSSSTCNSRTLVAGSNTLQYNLYLNSGRTAVWGDESEGTQAYSQRYLGVRPVQRLPLRACAGFTGCGSRRLL